MKLNIKKSLAIATIACAGFLPTFSQAMLVFDAANYSQTTITAIQQIKAQIDQVRQLQEQIKSNSANFAGKDIADLKREYDKVKRVYDSANALQNTLLGVQQNFDNLKAMFGSGNYQDFGSMAVSIGDRAKAGDAVAKNLYDNSRRAQDQMKDAFDRHQKIVDQASNVSGVTEATQATTAAVGVLIQQNNSMLAMMAADQTKKAVDASEINTEKQERAQAEMKYQQNMSSELKKILKK
ncbi:hypothetical protein [Polaromonas naphthalenivorans]|uniref:Conjugal transfer protein TrbJ n=1 Tax=Polaromonas naphthalenivorans (strain CJ2) TaxID=365044 RepID=A1VV33_POLNA|nr:hypothetical protein [Polaromonas naphthalenivorans]ABM39511.1 hypothetical protein Pnap_4228 [Polaromonas naphthalenivorans CJ2]